MMSLPTPAWPTFAPVAELCDAGEPTLLGESPAIRDLLRAVLAVPHISAAPGTVDCPVCQTQQALTPERVQEIRNTLAGSENAQQLAEAARAELESARGQVESLVTTLSGEQPVAVGWTIEEQQNHAAAAERLLPGEGAEAVTSLIAVAKTLKEPRVKALNQAKTLGILVGDATASFRAGGPVDLDALVNGARVTDALVAALSGARRTYSDEVGTFFSRLDAALSVATVTDGWIELLGIVRDYEKIPPEYHESEAHATLVKEVAAAQRTIDKARSGILDANFLSLSDEIGRWWGLLRPDEPIKFSKIKRRGAGIRHAVSRAYLRGRRAPRSRRFQRLTVERFRPIDLPG